MLDVRRWVHTAVFWMLIAGVVGAVSACGGANENNENAGAGGSGSGGSSARKAPTMCPDAPPRIGTFCYGFCVYDGGMCCDGIWLEPGTCLPAP